MVSFGLLPDNSITMKRKPIMSRNSVILNGIGFITFGMVALCYPGQDIQVMTFPFGFLLTLSGLVTMLRYLRGWDHRLRKLMFKKGVADFLLGITALATLMSSVPLLTELMAVWTVLTGILLMILFYHLREVMPGWIVMMISGFSAILFGVFMVSSMVSPAISLTYEVSIFAILLGSSMVYAYFKLREIPHFQTNTPDKYV